MEHMFFTRFSTLELLVTGSSTPQVLWFCSVL